MPVETCKRPLQVCVLDHVNTWSPESLPRTDQMPQRAELFALWLVLEHFAGDIDVATDSQSMISGFRYSQIGALAQTLLQHLGLHNATWQHFATLTQLHDQVHRTSRSCKVPSLPCSKRNRSCNQWETQSKSGVGLLRTHLRSMTEPAGTCLRLRS